MDANGADKHDILARLEPLLLFLVFYLPGYLLQSRPLSGRIFNDVTFNLTYLLQVIPRFALVLYVVMLRERLVHPGEPPALTLSRYGLTRIRAADFAWSIAVLVLIELIIIPLSLLGRLLQATGDTFAAARMHWQLTNPAILPLVFVTSIAAGYSEELFFRSYLLTALPAMGIGTTAAVIASTALFGLGHLYEGIIALVATLAIGAVLSLVFLRKRNLHVIAIAHGLYNFITLLATLSLTGVPL